MKVTYYFALAAAIGWGVWTVSADAAPGRGGGGRPGGGGGGARPSMGHVGGGGGGGGGFQHAGGGGGGFHPGGGGGGFQHPSAPSGGFSRPATPNVNVSRPATSNPSIGQAVRPIGPSNPISGGFHPTGGGTNINRPTNFPSNNVVNRPTVNVPNNVRPTTLPANNLIGSGSHVPVGVQRPSLGGSIHTPIGGGAGIPGPVGRPIIGHNPANPVGRPIVGGNNFVHGGNNFVHVGNVGGNNFAGNHVVGNRPGWDHGGHYNPNFGFGGGGNWAQNWHNHAINPYHHWYNGCWHGYWGSGWYTPLAWGALGWGLGSWTSGWGYGNSYYNPYYSQPLVATALPYDYSQPVVVNNFTQPVIDPNSGVAQPALVGQAPVPPTPETNPGLTLLDQGLAEFKAGAYRQSLTDFDASLRQLPNDPVAHEVRALALYAVGDYTPAAGALNSLLSSAPGMDWTTMSGLYGNPEDYTEQLRRLESHCKSNPNDAAADFLLAYHYLVIGAKDSAVRALQNVVKNQPKDVTARRMLDALAPPAVAETPAPAVVPDGGTPPQTDLVGTWRANAGGTMVELAITENSQFTWKANENGKPPIQLTGQLVTSNNSVSLDTKDQGSMAGAVTSIGPDQWQFRVAGAPAQDPGLTFQRVTR